ncbi:DUF3825 domain-containing protein, partial [Collinsella aerofaciens]
CRSPDPRSRAGAPVVSVPLDWVIVSVPQFYGGRIQLLLPLCLTGDKPELALTIQREDGFYAARTCLTLDMAYNNARLICRPETSWIKR